LRPRPLRFDELRAGNKARKQSKGTVAPAAGGGGLSPKQGKAIKKEPREYGAGGLIRRSSVSSTSSVHSGSGASDWDDNREPFVYLDAHMLTFLNSFDIFLRIRSSDVV
jgi:GATA-binding protein